MLKCLTQYTRLPQIAWSLELIQSSALYVFTKRLFPGSVEIVPDHYCLPDLKYINVWLSIEKIDSEKKKRGREFGVSPFLFSIILPFKHRSSLNM